MIDRTRRIIGGSVVGAIGALIVASLYLAPHYPFRFGWLGGIFLIFACLWMARWLLFPWRGRYVYRTDAASIIMERYAKGEITKEQFEQMLRDLRQEI